MKKKYKLSKKREKQFQAAREEFRNMRDLLLLNHYTLTFSHKPPKGKDTAASIHVSETRNRAVVRMSDHFYTCSPEDRRHYVIHELLHIFLAQMDYGVADLQNTMTFATWNIFYTNFHRNIEKAIDALADVLTPLSFLEERARKEQNIEQK